MLSLQSMSHPRTIWRWRLTGTSECVPIEELENKVRNNSYHCMHIRSLHVQDVFQNSEENSPLQKRKFRTLDSNCTVHSVYMIIVVQQTDIGLWKTDQKIKILRILSELQTDWFQERRTEFNIQVKWILNFFHKPDSN